MLHFDPEQPSSAPLHSQTIYYIYIYGEVYEPLHQPHDDMYSEPNTAIPNLVMVPSCNPRIIMPLYTPRPYSSSFGLYITGSGCPYSRTLRFGVYGSVWGLGV